jgi:hypothetical protein
LFAIRRSIHVDDQQSKKPNVAIETGLDVPGLSTQKKLRGKTRAADFRGETNSQLLLIARLRELGTIQSEIGNGLLIELSVRLDLLALLELLDSVLGLATPAAVGRTGLEPVLVKRLLNLPDLPARQVLR